MVHKMMNQTMSLNAIREAIEPMLHSRLQNYIIPGLTSRLVGGGDHGKVRLFQTDRQARDFVTPHSHRFDFTCLVLSGTVRNTLFLGGGAGTDEWCISTIDQVCGSEGLLAYTHTREPAPSVWSQETYTYTRGDTYHMKAAEIHSIQFDKGTQVLFFEGPQFTTTSRMLEPWVDGKVVPTFRTEPWMFDRTALETL